MHKVDSWITEAAGGRVFVLGMDFGLWTAGRDRGAKRRWHGEAHRSPPDEDIG